MERNVVSQRNLSKQNVVRDEFGGRLNVSAIIPLYTNKKIFRNNPLEDCEVKINYSMTAIEKAIVDASYMGVKAIWLVCRPEMQSFLRSRIGDFIIDPFLSEKSITDSYKRIPIFFLPIPDRYRDRRDSVPFQIVWGASYIFKMMTGISEWLMPHKYIFISPFAMVNHEEYKDYRPLIRSATNFSFVNNGKSIDQDELLPFSFTFEEWKIARQRLNDYLTEIGGTLINKDKFKLALNVQMGHIFGNLPNREYHEIKEYYRIDSWMHYCEYIKKSDLVFKRPYVYEDYPKWRRFNYQDFTHEKHLRLEIKDEPMKTDLDTELDLG